MTQQNTESLAQLEQAYLALKVRTSELVEQEALLRSITDAAQDAVILLDSAGLVTFWNPAAEQMFGYTKDEMIGQNLHNLLVPSEYIGAHQEGFSHFILSGTGPLIGKTRQVQAKRRSGEEFPVDISLSAIKLHGEWNAVGIVRDVTDRVKAEKIITDNSTHLAEAQRLAHIGSWKLDFTSGKLSWSDETFNLFEIDQNMFEATYKDFLNLIHPDDRDAVNQVHTDSLAKHQPYEIIHRLLMDDGRIKWVHERGSYNYNAEGKPLSSIGTTQDITERKKRDAELEKFKAIIESSDDAIISSTLDNIITSWNCGAEKIFGYTADEAINKPIKMLVPLDNLHEVAEIMGRIARNERVEHYETLRLHKDGHLIDISITISPILDEAGQLIGTSKIARDITEHKQMEKQMHQLAFYDSLTHLANRRLLLDRCEQALRASARRKNHGAILFLDLDKFKLLNDTQGHSVGDLLLIDVAQRLVASVRDEDTVARMGGDEFVVILEELSSDLTIAREQAKDVAEKIRFAIDTPFLLEDYSHNCSPSIGICLFAGRDQSIDELLMHADMAMYQAKAAGRNTVCVFDDDV